MTTPNTPSQALVDVEREDRATAAIEATGYLAGDEAREVARAVLSSTPSLQTGGEGD